jgi:hypothetical protein
MKKWKELKLLHRRIILCLIFFIIGIFRAIDRNSEPKADLVMFNEQSQILKENNDKLNELNNQSKYIEENKVGYDEFMKQ